MLEFSRLMLNETSMARKYFEDNPSWLCDYTIGGMFMWRDYFKTEYAICDEELIFKHRNPDGRIVFSMPFNLRALECIKDYCSHCNIPILLTTVSSKGLDCLKEHSSIINIESDERWFDYFYYREEMAYFKGRRFSKQRNHINKFMITYQNWRVDKITDNNLCLVKSFLEEYYSGLEKDSDLFQEEKIKTYEVVSCYKDYGFNGIILYVDKKVVAIAMGENINDVTFIHIEKALRDYAGVYQMIFNQYVINCTDDKIKYVNREEDIGDIGLRKSKLSYHPYCLLKKYIVEVDM